MHFTPVCVQTPAAGGRLGEKNAPISSAMIMKRQRGTRRAGRPVRWLSFALAFGVVQLLSLYYYSSAETLT